MAPGVNLASALSPLSSSAEQAGTNTNIVFRFRALRTHIFVVFRASISNKEPPANPSKKSVSLSEFLDRKLHKNNNGSLQVFFVFLFRSYFIEKIGNNISFASTWQRKQFPFPDRRSASEPIDETVLRRFISRPKQDCEEFVHLSKKRKSQYHISAGTILKSQISDPVPDQTTIAFL